MSDIKVKWWLPVTLALVVTFLFPVPPSQAAVNYGCLWNGAAGTAWTTAANWSSCGNRAPGPADMATIMSGQLLNQPTITTPVTVASLTITSGTLTVKGSGALTVSGNAFVDTSGQLTMGASTAAATVNQLLTIKGKYAGGGASLNANHVTIAGGTFNAPATLDVRGNWLFNGGTFNAGSGSASFGGLSTQVIGGTATTTFANLSIDNPSGVTLGHNIAVKGLFTLNADLTTTDTYRLVLNPTSTAAAGDFDVVGTVYRAGPFTLGTPYVFGSPLNTLAFNSMVTTGATSVTFKLTKAVPARFDGAINRDYEIVPAGIDSFVATLRLRYKHEDLIGSPNEAALRLWSSHNLAPWTLQGGVVEPVTNIVTLSNVTQFSEWGISDRSSPTAVSLSSFGSVKPAETPWALPALSGLLLLGVIAVVAARHLA